MERPAPFFSRENLGLIAGLAGMAVFAIATPIGIVTWVEHGDRIEEAYQGRVAASATDTYGAVLLEPGQAPWRDGVAVHDVMVSLPDGAAQCDVVAGNDGADVTLLCGTGKTEPARR